MSKSGIGFVIKSKRVLDKDFVKYWMEAKNNDERIIWIAKKLGVSESQVYRRAAALRKKGVNLPNMHFKYLTDKKIDELNVLISDMSSNEEGVIL